MGCYDAMNNEQGCFVDRCEIMNVVIIDNHSFFNFQSAKILHL